MSLWQSFKKGYDDTKDSYREGHQAPVAVQEVTEEFRFIEEVEPAPVAGSPETTSIRDDPYTSGMRVLRHSITAWEVEGTLLRHIAEGDYTPDELINDAVISKCRSFFVPVFEYRGEFYTSWAAAFGFDRTEHYQDTERYRDDQGNERYRPVTRTKTVTDWRPASGTDSGSFHLLGYCGTGLPSEVLPLVEFPSEASALRAIGPAEFGGLDRDARSGSAEEVYRQRVEADVRALVARGVARHYMGDRVRDVQWEYDVTKRSNLALIPVCHMTYEFEGQIYNLWVDGRDQTRFIADALPIDEARKNKTNMATLPALLVTIAVAVAAFKVDRLTRDNVIGGIVLIVVAWLVAGWRISKHINGSKELRTRALEARLPANRGFFHDGEAFDVGDDVASGIADEANQENHPDLSEAEPPADSIPIIEAGPVAPSTDGPADKPASETAFGQFKKRKS